MSSPLVKRLNLPQQVVKTDGTFLIAVQRDDLDLATDPRAKALAIADNRIGELDLEWDVEPATPGLEDRSIGVVKHEDFSGAVRLLVVFRNPYRPGR